MKLSDWFGINIISNYITKCAFIGAAQVEAENLLNLPYLLSALAVLP